MIMTLKLTKRQKGALFYEKYNLSSYPFEKMFVEGTHLNENLVKNIHLEYLKFYRESITNSIKTFYPWIYLKLVDI